MTALQGMLAETLHIPFWEFMLFTFAFFAVGAALGAAINQLQKPPPAKGSHRDETLALTRVERMPYVGEE